MTAFVANTFLETEICCNCGMVFAMPADYQRRRKDDHEWFFCPAGHKQHYTGQSEAQRLKAELARKEEMLAAADARANRVQASLTQVSKAHKKMRVRVMNGVCPCCNRSFPKLREHMKTQHPDFGAEQTLAALRQAFGMTQAAVAEEARVTPVYVSAYERGKYVPARAKARLDAWVELTNVS